MSFVKMNRGLAVELSQHANALGIPEGYSRVNHGRVVHTLLTTGAALCHIFGFMQDNSSKGILPKQRNTQARHESRAEHVRGAAASRPLPQIIFSSVWIESEKMLMLVDGNTRMYEALGNPAARFEEVELKIYEVSTRKEANALYKVFDNRKSVKTGNDDVQSLFREAGLIGALKSQRMRFGSKMVTPLAVMLGVSSLSLVEPETLAAQTQSLFWTDALLAQLEAVEAKTTKAAFAQVFGGGELAGFMLFVKERLAVEGDAASGSLGRMILDIVASVERMLGKGARMSGFTDCYAAYAQSTMNMGRSGSKVVPLRARSFKQHLDGYFQTLNAPVKKLTRKKA